MVLAELTAYLVTQSIGVSGTTLFYGKMPTDPDVLVSLFEYGGLMNEPELGGAGTTRLEFPRIQAVSRGISNDYDSPRLVMQNIITAFTKIANVTLSGIQYKAVQALQPAFFLMRDGNNRVLFACNFQVTKAYSST